MPRQSVKTTIDMTDAGRKRDLIRCIGCMSGPYQVDLHPTRPRRSNQQNRWYWSCIVDLLSKYLSDQDYDLTDAEAAHEVLRGRFLASTLRDPKNGEPIGRYVRSTTSLTTEEFSDYCERCRAWMADMFGIITEDPDPAWRSVHREAVPA
jgi:hypothetical protein